MRKPTIAELREKSLQRFNNDYIHNMNVARTIINSYYRLEALSTRNANNDTEKNQGKKWYIEDENKEIKMAERLEKMLAPYGLILAQPGCYEIAKNVGNTTAIRIVYDSYFYD